MGREAAAPRPGAVILRAGWKESEREHLLSARRGGGRGDGAVRLGGGGAGGGAGAGGAPGPRRVAAARRRVRAPSEPPIRVTHPSRPSESSIRVADPSRLSSRPSESPIRVAHPSRPGQLRARCGESSRSAASPVSPRYEIRRHLRVFSASCRRLFSVFSALQHLFCVFSAPFQRLSRVSSASFPRLFGAFSAPFPRLFRVFSASFWRLSRVLSAPLPRLFRVFPARPGTTRFSGRPESDERLQGRVPPTPPPPPSLPRVLPWQGERCPRGRKPRCWACSLGPKPCRSITKGAFEGGVPLGMGNGAEVPAAGG